MKVLFASGTMGGGGAERVVSILANEFVTRGLEVSILVVRGPSVYPLDSRVRLLPLYHEEEFTGTIVNKILRRFIYLYRLLTTLRAESPDVVIPVHGGGWNGLFVLLGKALGKKVIASEHTSYSVLAGQPLCWFERHFFYRLADTLTVLTETDYNYYSGFLNNVEVLPNPLGFPIYDLMSVRENTVLAAGELDRWYGKGLDILLSAFAIIAPKYPSWCLQIAGTGSGGRAYLENLAETLGVTSQVNFLGFKNDIDLTMRTSAVFALCSRYEGFGMVLLEAMSQGCACVSLDCSAGPVEMIDHQIDGLLVPAQDVTKLAETLEHLILDETLRDRLSTAARLKAAQFAASRITEKWFQLFRSLQLVD